MMIKNLFRKGRNLQSMFSMYSSRSEGFVSQKIFQENHEKIRTKGLNFSMMLGALFSTILINNNLKCEDKQNSDQDNKQSLNVDIYELNKSQFLELLTNINQEGILIVFNKYQRSQKSSQFEKNLEMVYNKCKQLGIGKIYLIERNDIRHLETFERWLREQPEIKPRQTQKQSKNQYFFFTPDFPKNPLKIQEQQIKEQITQIRKYRIRLNPSDLNQQIVEPFKKIFNRTTVIKQCPQYTTGSIENKCIQDYRKNITTLIEQGMLKNKSNEYRFYALTPKSKKDFSPILAFHKILKEIQQKQETSKEQPVTKIEESHRSENLFVLKNDLLGNQVQNMKDFKARNYSMLKGLSNYERFLLFIRPRVFIVSKSNPSIDLYWYVTCLHKNKKATISINNTDSFNLGRKYKITDGFSYPQNIDLQFLKILYKNHPQLNYLIVNTEIVSELIRHLPIKRKYVIYDLTSDLHYPKLFLPEYNINNSPLENYNLLFKPQIEKYLSNPKSYDQIVLDKQKKINSKQLKYMMQKNQSKFILRVCNMNCSNDLNNAKLQKLFHKLKDVQQNSQQNEQHLEKDCTTYDKNWKNQIYKKTFWIDTGFNNVGLKEGDYIFSQGKYQEI